MLGMMVLSSCFGCRVLVLQDGETPVCFRYVVKPTDSHVTNVFKPSLSGSGGEEEAQPDSWRHSTLGGVFVGSMDKLISNKRASVVWEARVRSSMFF